MSTAQHVDDYIYGPVPSRRLGRSLGVDLVPYKTCTYDCVYCQLGRTTNKTTERREYVPVDAVQAGIARHLAAGDTPDYISLAGSGEPTLHSGIGRLIRLIKGMTDIPVAMITNGSLLWMEEVQEELSEADLVLPSLDAGDAEMFEQVNRPDPSISFDLMVDGLAAFTGRFDGQVWLEVMLLAGLTDTPSQVEKIAQLVEQIAPTRVQLNTASRPPVEGFVHALPEERMHALAGLFSRDVEVICDFTKSRSEHHAAGATDDAGILALLARRPCTADDIAAGLGLHVLDVLKRLDILLAEKQISPETLAGRTFYAPTGSTDKPAP